MPAEVGEIISVGPAFIGRRLDQYLTEQLSISRARVQMLLEQSGVMHPADEADQKRGKTDIHRAYD